MSVRFWFSTVVLVVSLGLFFFPSDFFGSRSTPFGTKVFEAEVIGVSGAQGEQTLRVRFDFRNASREADVLNDYVPLEVGDTLYLQPYPFESADPTSFTIMNIDRSTSLVWLFVLFAVVCVLVGGMQGVYALLGLFFSFVVVLRVLIPLILAGASPLIYGIAVSLLIFAVTLFLSHGFSRKSLAALIGTLFSLVLTAVIAHFAIQGVQLTGFTDESLALNFFSGRSLEFVSLLIAGVLIAALGVLDDAAVAQASTVFTLVSESGLWGVALFRKALVVGRDHIAALVNTLMFAYAGAALPLLLLFHLNSYPFSFIVSTEAISTEVVRTLVASIGLIFAIPFTTLVSVFLIRLDRARV